MEIKSRDDTIMELDNKILELQSKLPSAKVFTKYVPPPRMRRRRHGAHRCCGDRVEEDPIRQDEDGVVQAALGVGAAASVTLLLLRRRRRRRRCRRRRRRRHRCSCLRGTSRVFVVAEAVGSVTPNGGSDDDDAAGPERPP